MSGISQTDWSWCPLITDFDNDGYRDLIVTNGFPRDVSDHDFIAYRKRSGGQESTMSLLNQIPQVKIHNYAFHNQGDLTFKDVTSQWGLTEPTFSSGAAYADFDNDGAMDMVISNINDEALLYRNTSRDKDSLNSNFLQIKFHGDKQNINGIGASATIFYDNGKLQAYDNNPYRGYISTDEDVAHFGLGKTKIVDSVIIKWGNGKKQILKNVKVNQVITVDIRNATESYSVQQPIVDTTSLFTDVTGLEGINYKHKDIDNFIDFNIQIILPHKFTEYCPAIATGDIDGNGLDDMVVGGNTFNSAQIFFQQADGKFIQRKLDNSEIDVINQFVDEGILIFDANGDGKPDVYISSGGYKNAPNSKNYQDRLYINEGNAIFKMDSSGIAPEFYQQTLCKGF